MTIYTLFLYVAIAALGLTLTAGVGHAKLKKHEVMHPVYWFFQYFMGSLLLFSGFIKAVDPMGTAYKMEEYFGEFVNQGLGFMSFFAEYALAFSVFMLVFELVLGFCFILGIGRAKTLKLNFLLMLFFTLLTGFNYLTGYTPNGVGIFDFSGWTAFKGTNIRIVDCGCFGDFMKLTPQTTFVKDIILTAMSIGLMVSGGARKMKELVSDTGMVRSIIVTILMVATLLFCMSNYYFALPMIDFRPFHEGVNITAAKAKCAENKPEIKRIYTLLNEDTNAEEMVSMEDYMADKKYWAAPYKLLTEKTQDEVISEGCTSKIKEFGMEGDEDENQQRFLAIEKDQNYNFLVVIKKPEYASASGLKAVSELSMEASKAGYNVNGFYSYYEGNLEEWRHEHQLAFDILQADDKLLGTIIRANPGVLLLKNGTIIKKWHHMSIPTLEEAKEFMK